MNKKIQKLTEKLGEELTKYVNDFARDNNLSPEDADKLLNNIGQTVILNTISDIVESIPEGDDREAMVNAINDEIEETFDNMIEKYNIDIVEIMENSAQKTMGEVFYK